MTKALGTVATLLDADSVVTDLDAHTRDDALAALVDRMCRRNPDVDCPGLQDAIVGRERQASTALGDGIAIPHARLAHLDRMLAVFGRSATGIPWDAPDGSPVHFILLLAGPAEAPGTYLKTLAAASRLLGKHGCRTRLSEASSGAEILLVLHDEARAIGNGAAAR